MAEITQQQTGLSRRTFIRAAAGIGAGFVVYGYGQGGFPTALAAVPGGTLDTASLPKFVTPLLVPPVMPIAAVLRDRGEPVDYYEISVRQVRQQVLPPELPPTEVWAYGPVSARSPNGPLIHHAPSLTIEATHARPVRVKWVNDLVDDDGNYLPHLLPVDPTLHWANPPGGLLGRDGTDTFATTPGPYTGPVPIVTHLHGAVDVGQESDGYPEAWYLPAARDLPPGYATEGSWYERFADEARSKFGVEWGRGYAVSQYPNHDRARAIWFHDHSLGMTRLNVYAGPAGFYLVRGGADDDVRDARSGRPAQLPGPAPRARDDAHAERTYRELPLAIQDRAFNADGSLFYPDSRAFFDEITGPYVPDGPFPPIWNPEFFGNILIVNGRTWPFVEVEQRRYRLRVLNGCQSRFLILDFSAIPGVSAWLIGNDGGFLSQPVNLADQALRLLIGPAERADIVVDFSRVATGTHVLRNVGPDEPFGGGEPGVDFEPADPLTTGQILQFRVVPALGVDRTTPPQFLQLPAIKPLPAEDCVRRVALIEQGAEGALSDDEVEGPTRALLGTVENGLPTPYAWDHEVTERPHLGDTEIWEIYNATADAHPVHIHEVAFEVVSRQQLVTDVEGEVRLPLQLTGDGTPAQPWESGFKDTVVAFPGQVTRLRATFGIAGRYVWHCHILEHEDHEMMRPFQVEP
jgi:spore coat protein A, manganese oxidase